MRLSYGAHVTILVVPHVCHKHYFPSLLARRHTLDPGTGRCVPTLFRRTPTIDIFDVLRNRGDCPPNAVYGRWGWLGDIVNQFSCSRGSGGGTVCTSNG